MGAAGGDMNIHEEPQTPRSPSNGCDGREYIVGMIRSLSVLARRSGEEEMALLLEAIVAATRARERRKR